MSSVSIGKSYEKLSCKYLKGIGHTIVDTNWYCKFGEIDIISEKDTIFHFIEVKYRSKTIYGQPYQFVTPYKRYKLRKTIAEYLFSLDFFISWQFDVISITPNKLNYIKDLSL